MKIALVTSRYADRPGVRERHVQRLAHGLARRGATVEVLALGRDRGRPQVVETDGVMVRRFSPAAGNRGLVAPALWEHLRRGAASYDVIHLHGAHLGLGLTVARSAPGRFMFTPHVPIEHLCRWPYARLLRGVIERASLAICASRAEADRLCRALPWAVDRVRVVPHGVDVIKIEAARPLPQSGHVVLAVGRLGRHSGVARATAAMASLGPEFQLVVVGDGPARRALQAYAADLRVSSRVRFTGALPDASLYRWLQTASVVVALGERQASGLQMLEAVSAGAAVVASATPTHREIAAYLEERAIVLVSLTGSPLEVADAISMVAGTPPCSTTRAAVPSWDEVVDRIRDLYGGARADRAITESSPRFSRARAQDRGSPPGIALGA
jgi:glycosyltransferase involved in cell wall biosynthesis